MHFIFRFPDYVRFNYHNLGQLFVVLICRQTQPMLKAEKFNLVKYIRLFIHPQSKSEQITSEGVLQNDIEPQCCESSN